MNILAAVVKYVNMAAMTTSATADLLSFLITEVDMLENLSKAQ